MITSFAALLDNGATRFSLRSDESGLTRQANDAIDAIWTANSLKERIKGALDNKRRDSLKEGQLRGAEFNPYPAIRMFAGLAKKSRDYFAGYDYQVKEWNDFLIELGIEELNQEEITFLETIHGYSSHLDSGKKSGALWTGGIAVIVGAFLVYFLQPNGKQEGGLEGAIESVKTLSPGELEKVKIEIGKILGTKDDSEVEK